MRIEIRPIDKKSWHKKEGAESFTQPKVIEAFVDSNTGSLATGLTKEEEKKYGQLLNVDLDASIVQNGRPHPFYSSKRGWLVLPNKTIFLDIENPLEFVKYKLAMASKFVANSLKEYEMGLYPEATHVIYDEEMEINKKATKIQKKNRAIEIAISLSVDEKANLIQILRNKIVRGRSQDFVDVIIDEIIENSVDEFLRFAKMDKTEVYTRSIILEALSKNILLKEANAIYYMGDVLGYDYEEVVRFFLDPQNQKLKVALLEKLNV